MEAYLAASDTVRQQGEQEAIAMAEAAYNYSQIEKRNARIEQENLRQQNWIIGLFILLLMSSSAIGLYAYISKQKHRFLCFNLQTYKEKLLILQQKQDQQTASANWNALREDFFPNGSHQNLSEDKWREMTTRIRTIAPDFKRKLIELCKMDEHSYRMCALIKMELRPAEIADILCLTKSAISNQRKRLYKKAFGEDGSPDDWDEIVRAI